MSDSVYHKLREVLDAIPNGFPATDTGVEIRLLKKIFSEEEADLAVKLKLSFETADQIAARTGLGREYLDRMLPVMDEKGQLWCLRLGDTAYFRLMPFVFGIYEFQLRRIDREMAELFEEYIMKAFGKEFFSRTPALMKVVPIGIDVSPDAAVETYESCARLIDSAKSWGVNECICKKERALMGHRCDRPLEVCMAFAPIEGVFDGGRGARPITREEAHRILRISEEAGLVHQISNTKTGHFYICNCCKCCCGPLLSYRFISENAVAKSGYRAVVDAGECTACGACEDRCQVGAIRVNDLAEIGGRCIGCGLCVASCPCRAITLARREEGDVPPVPGDELEWLAERARSRGMGDDYKKLL